jgi:hypothetical protein
MNRNRGYSHDLAGVRGEIDAARAALADLYRKRTELTAEAIEAGMPRAEIAQLLGIVRPAINKILAGQDGMPARLGHGGEEAFTRTEAEPPPAGLPMSDGRWQWR